MNNRIHSTLFAFLIFAAPAGLSAQDAPRSEGGTLSLAAALETAARDNPQLRSHADGVRAAGYTRTSQRAKYLPTIKVDANGIVWDRALDLSLGGEQSGAPQLPPPSTPYEQAFAGLLGSLSTPTTIREQFTAEIGVTVIQPLSALITLSTAYELFDLTAAMRKLQQREAVRAVQQATATAYFRLLQARAMRDTAKQSVVQMQAQLDRVKLLVKGGVAGENDRLKLEVAVGAAQQKELAAQNAVALASVGLATLMGAPSGGTIVPAPLPNEVIPATTADLGQACENAIANRLEVQLANTGVRLAEVAGKLEKAKLVPSVNLLANYKHSEGSSFANADAAFVGVFLEWQAFRWHATTSEIKAANARASELRGQVEALKAGICLSVKQAALRHQTAVASLEVAERAETEAIEAARLETKRFEAGAATSTDVVVAEAALSVAQGNRLAAFYESFVAHAELRAALGEPLTAQSLVSRN